MGGVSSGIISALSGGDGIATGGVHVASGCGGRGSSWEGEQSCGVQSWVKNSCPQRAPPSPRVSSHVSADVADFAVRT
jgi:hypothetical protein